MKLGLLNTRYKDYYDLRHLARNFDFDGALLVRAMAATFARRKTTLPAHVPVGLSAEFHENAQRQIQWKAFCRRLAAQAQPELSDVMSQVASFVIPPLRAAARSEDFAGKWSNATQWETK